MRIDNRHTLHKNNGLPCEAHQHYKTLKQHCRLNYTLHIAQCADTAATLKPIEY